MNTPIISKSVKILKQKFTHSLGLPIHQLLPSEVIQEELAQLNIKYRQRLFDPICTLWAFLSQVLDVDKSCHNAVSRVIAYLVGSGVELPSTDTSAYCQARQRLPEELIQKLFGKVAVGLESQVNETHLWCGRKVKVIDGSTVSMPDTPDNQNEYPQPSSQKIGCGFPLAKIGALFSIATGAAVALAIDVFNTHDIQLARRLYEFLSPGDVLLGDRAFCAYADIFQIKSLGGDAVFRKHQGRQTQMRRGKIVGSCDKIVTWSKPKKCPQGLSQEEFNSLPNTLIVREIYFYIFIPGFRTEQVSLITTLLDTKAYSTLDITSLYEKRWDVEVDLKHLKTTLGMDILRSKTPAMVRKEIWAFLLAYNLLRTLMWSAGNSYGVSPLRLSLQGTRQHFDNFIPQFIAATNSDRHQIYSTLLKVIVHKEVPLRQARSEPRVRKRRPKSYPLMQELRQRYHDNLKTA
ncbi:IS4 family transposase [Nodularia spumigena]|uniref:Transposase IS4-like domain-containing protein n=1 Tax=Nodularia spumigena UHCC 0039 TaxID=1914872 RepID=A0A2S0QAQ8_NODSP|nr:IS4 family transposase [Nodularia spumigena]AVZ31725.1 hypothetical protein BMF81_04730 [Nodularia spumigena UHCC 0039]